MNPLPIILPYDRAISWAEYCRNLEEGHALALQVCRENRVDIDPEIFREKDQAQTDAILLDAAASLGIPTAEVYRAAHTGRIEWMRPYEHEGTSLILARLDKGGWIKQPNLQSFNALPPPAIQRRHAA